MKYRLAFLCLPLSVLLAQEAGSGVDLSATVSGDALYSNNPANAARVVAGLRAVLYPTWKIGKHWIVSGALQADSTPFFQDDDNTRSYHLKFQILQATLGYSRVWNKASVLLRAGQLSSAFGSFLLRYDDAVNPLLAAPLEYGYYYYPVTTGSLAGVQADVTLGKWDGRLQLVNSSAANPRGVLEKDQYPNWAGGAGYTIRQGLHVGVSAYRGPFLARDYHYYLPGELQPRELPATGLGADAEWAHGHWNLYGEAQHFVLAYHAIPTLFENAGYLESRRVLHPRWYVAARIGHLHNNYNAGKDTYEFAVGFRPNGHQLIKVGYTLERNSGDNDVYRTLALQVVTTLHPFSRAWN